VYDLAAFQFKMACLRCQVASFLAVILAVIIEIVELLFVAGPARALSLPQLPEEVLEPFDPASSRSAVRSDDLETILVASLFWPRTREVPRWARLS
jgi:hypothetical protein